MSRLLVLSRENPYKSLGFIVKLPPELNLEGGAPEGVGGRGEGVVFISGATQKKRQLKGKNLRSIYSMLFNVYT